MSVDANSEPRPGKAAPTLPVHADNNWLPAPFPEWETLLTACWALDEFTLAGGPT